MGINTFCQRATACSIAALLGWCATGLADEPKLFDKVHLRNGGVIEGTVQDQKIGNQLFYIIETPDGATIKLRRSQVKHVVEPTDADREYLRLRAEMVDTVDDHWRMQQWCIEQNPPLRKEREYHLQRIIQLDPDHGDARARLGYKDQAGAWVHYEQQMQANGYIKDDRGIFRLPSGMAIAAENERIDGAIKDWNKNISSWIKKLKKRNDKHAAQALEQLKTIRDPLAVEGLVTAIKRENNANMRSGLVDTLGQIKSYRAQNALVELAIQGDLNTREQCINLLKLPHFDRPSVIQTIKPYLNPTPTTPNELVNRAAFIAGEMKEKSAVLPLINALKTTHKFVLQPAGGATTFSSGSDGVGMTQGNNQPREIIKVFDNQTVLDALRAITQSTDYGFDQESWINWYITNHSLISNQLNRDE